MCEIINNLVKCPNCEKEINIEGGLERESYYDEEIEVLCYECDYCFDIKCIAEKIERTWEVVQ